jgi:hypothetical protein
MDLYLSMPSSPRRLHNSLTSSHHVRQKIRWTFKYATPNNSRNANALKSPKKE